MWTIIIQLMSAFATFMGILCAMYSSNRDVKITQQLDLFNKRLSIFTLSEELHQVILDNKDCIKVSEDEYSVNTVYYSQMINCPSLYHLSDVVPEPMNAEGPGPLDNPKAQTDFLLTKAALLKKSKVAAFIFMPPQNEKVSDFIKCYVLMLDGRRRYQIGCQEFQKQYDQFAEKSEGYEEFLKHKTNEKSLRAERLEQPSNDLINAYDAYCKDLPKIENQLTFYKK